MHIQILLGQMDLGDADAGMLALQLTAALDGHLLLYLSASDLTDGPQAAGRIAQSCRTSCSAYARPDRQALARSPARGAAERETS